MEIISLQTTSGMRKFDLAFGSLSNMTSPRHAITTTNLNHSEVPDYKTNFYEILLESVDYLYDRNRYNKFVTNSRNILQKYQNKKIIISVKGIASRKITINDFKRLCKLQADVGLSPIRLFFRHNLYRQFSNLFSWFIEEYKNIPYEYVLDHNTNLQDFMSLYLDSISKKHKAVYFINRIPTKNNKDKFVFIQGRTNDEILRWISLMNKKTKNGALNPLYYYWLGYDVTGFNTRRGGYQVPEYDLEVIKGFRYVPASSVGDNCVIIPTNTLAQSIYDYGLEKRDSVPCSAFSIVELNTNYENFARRINPQIILAEIQNDITAFNSL